MRLPIALSIALVLAMVFGAPEARAQTERWDSVKDRVFYFVLPDRFENGDPTNDRAGIGGDALLHGFLPDNKAYYHGGDLAGLIDRLPYLDRMGVSAIWLGPIFRNKPVQGDGTIEGSSSGYHGYWTLDYTRIDPHFGVNAELQELVDAAHARDIKVFFDIITNHTADVVKYNECHDGIADSSGNGTDDLDADGPLPGGACPYRSIAEYPFDTEGGAGGAPINSGFLVPDAPLAESNFDALADMRYAFTPYVPAEERNAKEPAWLNDIHYYHNRGDSTFTGENSLHGDFVGLDDLFTEHPDVVAGMTEIFMDWITDYRIDGFRVDTVKHVNIEFWQQFSPAILDHASAQGIPDFFMFGEVFDSTPQFLSRFTTEGQLPAVLDFGFQAATQAVVADNNPTDLLRRLFADDDYYTDADSDAGLLPTFVGNHDIGRISYFIRRANPGAGGDEVLARVRLAHGLMFFARGMPVVYYGDEQGFVGDGNDQDARQDMFPSQVASYNDDVLVGTLATTAQSNFDRRHPLYRAFRQFARLRDRSGGLRYGDQFHRYSEDGPGLYAFSRIDRNNPVEYLVVINSSDQARTAAIPVLNPNRRYRPMLPRGRAIRSAQDATLTVTVPAFDLAVYRAAGRPNAQVAPDIRFASPSEGESVTGRLEVCIAADTAAFGAVSFDAVIAGEPVPLGVDPSPSVFRDGDNTSCPRGEPTYRVFLDTLAYPHGSEATLHARFATHAGRDHDDDDDDGDDDDDDWPPVDESFAQVSFRLTHERPSVALRYENGNDRTGFYGITDTGAVLFPTALGEELSFPWPDNSGSMVLFFESGAEADGFAFDVPVTIDLRRDVLPAAEDGPDGFVATLFLNDDHVLSTTDNFADGDTPPASMAAPFDAPPPFGTVTMHVRGGMNGWGTGDPMDYVGQGAYGRTIALGAGLIEHKFADAFWSDPTNFGAPFSEDGLNRGGGSGNLVLQVEESGDYRFNLFRIDGVGQGGSPLTFYRVAPVP